MAKIKLTSKTINTFTNFIYDFEIDKETPVSKRFILIDAEEFNAMRRIAGWLYQNEFHPSEKELKSAMKKHPLWNKKIKI